MKFHIQENPNTSPAYQAHFEIRDEENQVVAIINGGHEKAKANAALIAAAPDLLEALELALPILEVLHNAYDPESAEDDTASDARYAIDQVRAAIAKAEGGAA